jgi:hypothetical protein
MLGKVNSYTPSARGHSGRSKFDLFDGTKTSKPLQKMKQLPAACKAARRFRNVS